MVDVVVEPSAACVVVVEVVTPASDVVVVVDEVVVDVVLVVVEGHCGRPLHATLRTSPCPNSHGCPPLSDSISTLNISIRVAVLPQVAEHGETTIHEPEQSVPAAEVDGCDVVVVDVVVTSPLGDVATCVVLVAPSVVVTTSVVVDEPSGDVATAVVVVVPTCDVVVTVVVVVTSPVVDVVTASVVDVTPSA